MYLTHTKRSVHVIDNEIDLNDSVREMSEVNGELWSIIFVVVVTADCVQK